MRNIFLIVKKLSNMVHSSCLQDNSSTSSRVDFQGPPFCTELTQILLNSPFSFSVLTFTLTDIIFNKPRFQIRGLHFQIHTIKTTYFCHVHISRRKCCYWHVKKVIKLVRDFFVQQLVQDNIQTCALQLFCVASCQDLFDIKLVYTNCFGAA